MRHMRLVQIISKIKFSVQAHFILDNNKHPVSICPPSLHLNALTQNEKQLIKNQVSAQNICEPRRKGKKKNPYMYICIYMKNKHEKHPPTTTKRKKKQQNTRSKKTCPSSPPPSPQITKNMLRRHHDHAEAEPQNQVKQTKKETQYGNSTHGWTE